MDDASLLYAKAHKQNFVKRIVADKIMVPDKVAIFMAGSPGAGKTEVATALAELSDNLCIIACIPELCNDNHSKNRCNA